MREPDRHETVVDRQIRLAQERGDFDNLPGKGKPLPWLDEPDDELWWVKGYLRREGLSTDALLPTSIQLLKEIERLPENLSVLHSEDAVREIVRDLNLRIAQYIRAPVGPRVRLAPVRVEKAIADWHAGRVAAQTRHDRPEPAEPAPEPSPPHPAGRRRGWFRRSR